MAHSSHSFPKVSFNISSSVGILLNKAINSNETATMTGARTSHANDVLYVSLSLSHEPWVVYQIAIPIMLRHPPVYPG